MPDYNFNYVAEINGAACSFDSFNISINPYSGKIMSYYMNWNDTIVLPPSDKAMKLEDAYTTLYKKATLKLKYVKIYNYDKVSVNQEIKLAYVLENFSGTFDAATGVFLDYNGKPILEKAAGKYTDIKGNPAETDINLLVDLGVIDDSGSTFKPNNKILQKILLKCWLSPLDPVM